MHENTHKHAHLGIKVKLKMCPKLYSFADLQGHVIMYTYVYTVQLIPFSTYTRELSEFELVIWSHIKPKLLILHSALVIF